jgi:hypothetical protein
MRDWIRRSSSAAAMAAKVLALTGAILGSASVAYGYMAPPEEETKMQAMAVYSSPGVVGGWYCKGACLYDACCRPGSVVTN